MNQNGRRRRTSPEEVETTNINLLAQMNMAGYLAGNRPTGPHGHFPTHPSLSPGLGSGLAGMPMPGLGHFGLGHSLDPVPFSQGKFYAPQFNFVLFARTNFILTYINISIDRTELSLMYLIINEKLEITETTSFIF